MKWDLGAFYRDFSSWKEECQAIDGLRSLREWQGKLGDLTSIHECLKEYFNKDRLLNKIYTYTHLRFDEDQGNEEAKANHERATNLMRDFMVEASWIEPELLRLPEEIWKEILGDSSFSEFHFFLEKLYRQRDHVLSEKEEALMALGSKALAIPYKTFSAWSHADMTFPTIEDGEGKSLPLSHATYSAYLKMEDRVLRRNAFVELHRAYDNHAHMLTELVASEIETHQFPAKARGYRSCLEAALQPYRIDTHLYSNLIATVRKRIGSLHRYMALRKQWLKLDELHIYDLYVPLVGDLAGEIPYESAVDWVVESVAPLGQEYCEQLRRGLKEEGWVDVYEAPRKRSGAYSSGCYDSRPYILLNYQGTFADALTLAHECGHSMHSQLSRRHQPYPNSHYPIFVAEVASTFNEQLLADFLMKKATDPREIAFYLNHQIDGIRTTFFRQVFFAEFEWRIHNEVEEGRPLTLPFMKDLYIQLHKDYYGPDLVLDDLLAMEWARIPHFYYNFYVYQYATGISASIALFSALKKSAGSSKDYLRFLKAGGSADPIDLLKIAGVDMNQEKPILDAIDQFDHLIEQLTKYSGSLIPIA